MTDNDKHTDTIRGAIQDRIIPPLLFIDGPFPIDVIEDACANWPHVRELLLEAFREAVARPQNFIADQIALPIYTLFLAAEMRDTDFAVPMLDLMKLPADVIEELIGETTLAECMGRCLASTWQGDEQPIRDLIFDTSRDMFVRMAALDALAVRAVEGDTNPDAVIDLVFSILEKSAEALKNNSSRKQKTGFDDAQTFFNMLISMLADLGGHRYWPQVEQWNRDGLVDPMNEPMESLREGMFGAREFRIDRMFKPWYVRDTTEEMSGWACFHEPEAPDTYVREQPKIGRNDACPCGSGKKFKKCCGAEL